MLVRAKKKKNNNKQTPPGFVDDAKLFSKVTVLQFTFLLALFDALVASPICKHLLNLAVWYYCMVLSDFFFIFIGHLDNVSGEIFKSFCLFKN